MYPGPRSRSKRKERIDYIVPRRVFGFDESNHGRIPEILVVAHSQNGEFLEEHSVSLSKVRRGEEGLLALIAADIDYKFLAIPTRELVKKFYTRDNQGIAISEIIKSFDIPDISDSALYIDGTRRSSISEVIYSQLLDLGFTNRNKILCEPKADINYRIVNAADNIARVLFRIYDQRGEEGLKRYSKKRVSHEFLESL